MWPDNKKQSEPFYRLPNAKSREENGGGSFISKLTIAFTNV